MKRTTRPRKIYIAASSTELARAKEAARTATLLGLEIAGAWWSDVEDYGEANPEDDDEARIRYSVKDLKAVRSADIFWLLMPGDGFVSVGAFVEFGIALEHCRHIFASGKTRDSIFMSLAEEHATDDEAAASIAALLTLLGRPADHGR